MTALRTVRRRHLLSQRDLARVAGVTSSTIYLIEGRKVTPRIKIMRLICEALDIQDPNEIDEFADALKKMDDDHEKLNKE